MRTFRSRRARVVSIVVIVASLLLFGGVAVLMPSTGPGAWGPADRVAMLAIGVGIGILMSRYATIHATASDAGLTVRNLAGPRTLAWSEIDEVHFSGGMPWVRLHLHDGDELAVMAIQKADGPSAREDALELATLVRRGHDRG
ncbi:PH domain-containing protein [Janibacter sp. G1551]